MELELMKERMKFLEENLKANSSANRLADEIRLERNEGKANRKRDRDLSPRRGPDEPFLWDLSEVTGKDNAHDVLCWPLRRNFRRINAHPASYWSESKYPASVEPNLGQGVFLDHLIPLTLNPKALDWLHGPAKKVELKYLTFGNNSCKKAKSEMIISAKEVGIDQMDFSAATAWKECGSTREVMEGTLNFVGALFMIRPWDYQGLVLLRALHEVSYFAGVTNTEATQKHLAESFVNEVVAKNCQRFMQHRAPMDLVETVNLADILVQGTLGCSGSVRAPVNTYSAWREVQKLRKEKKDLANKNKDLKTRLDRADAQ